MKKKRKLIGVLLSEVTGEYREHLLRGIITQAKEYDYNVAVFATFVKVEGTYGHNQGEANIFQLPNYDKFDGIIFAPDTIRVDGASARVEADLHKRCKCPVICADMGVSSFPRIPKDDREDMRRLVNHFIKDHGFRSINCLTGPRTFTEAELRLQGYKDALAENNIPIDINRIRYGDFWRDSGVGFVDDIMNGLIPFPEAIVCTNDYMAITVCNTLEEYGLRVPDDVCVSGYDNIKAARHNSPTITTVEMPIADIGRRSVKAIHEVISGIEDRDDSVLHGELILGESCGCINSEENRKNAFEKAVNYQLELEGAKEDFYAMSIMGENLIGISDLGEFFIGLKRHFDLLKDYNEFYLCLCEDWDGKNEDNDCYRRNGYSDNMIQELAVKNQQFILEKNVFPSKEMLPALFAETEHRRTFYFVPVHFKDRCFGYAVLAYRDNFKSFDFTYRSWIQNINNSLEFVRVQNNLRWCYDRLDEIAVSDALTGIYNRRGFDRYAGNIFTHCVEEQKPFLLLIGDLDNLKRINDNFGHTEGDRALITVAEAFKSIRDDNAVYARIGGDEFVTVLNGDYTKEQAEQYKQKIYQYLDSINRENRYPYLIGTSIGIYYGIPDAEMSINDCIDTADKLMYTEKHKKKHEFIRGKQK